MANESQGTTTMEATQPFATGIRGIASPRPGASNGPPCRPAREYAGQSLEWCLNFRAGQMAPTSINERLRSLLAQANLDVPAEDLLTVAQAINASDQLVFTSEDGLLSVQSWRPDGTNLWVLARYFQEQTAQPR